MTTSAWIVLLAPLAGFLIIALTSKVLPWRVHGWIGTLAIAVSFVAAVATLIALQDRGEEQRQVVSVAWAYADAGGVKAQVATNPKQRKELLDTAVLLQKQAMELRKETQAAASGSTDVPAVPPEAASAPGDTPK